MSVKFVTAKSKLEALNISGFDSATEVDNGGVGGKLFACFETADDRHVWDNNVNAARQMGRRTSPQKAKSSASNGKLGGRPTLRQKAEKRVDASSELMEYKSIIMYDWPEGNEHWRWVQTAPISEIVDWAKTVEP